MPKPLFNKDRYFQQQYNSITKGNFNPYYNNLSHSLVEGYNPAYFLQRAKQLQKLNNVQGHQQKNYKNKNLNHPGYKKRPPHDVYEQDIQCVYEGKNGKGKIFIGNLQAAQNLQTLKKHNIGSVLTACKGIFIDHPKTHIQNYLYIPGEDHERFDLSVHFDQAVDFIKKSTQETNILVHCMAGISRSVSLVLAYLMKEKGMNYNQAYNIVKKNRKIINPNPGFIRQLQRYQKQLQKEICSRNRSIQQFQRFRGNRQIQNRRNAFSPQNYQKRYKNQYTNPQALYKRARQNQNFYKSQAEIRLNNQKNLPLNSSSTYNSSKNNNEQTPYRTNLYIDRPKSHYQKNYIFFDDQGANDGFKQYRNYQKFRNINQSKINMNKTVNYDNYRTKLSSYNQLNKEIDEKIKNIRDKYTKYTMELAQNRKEYNSYNITNSIQTHQVNQNQTAKLQNDRLGLYNFKTPKNSSNLGLLINHSREKEENYNISLVQSRRNLKNEDLEYDYPRRKGNSNLWATDRLREMFQYKKHAVDQNFKHQKVKYEKRMG